MKANKERQSTKCICYDMQNRATLCLRTGMTVVRSTLLLCGPIDTTCSCGTGEAKLSPANLIGGFGASAVFVSQLLIIHIGDFNEI